jgi:hypothetical protein
VLKIIKFQNWSTFGYNGSSGVPVQQVKLASVGTNWHTVKLAFQTNQLTAFFDNIQLMSVIDTESQPYISGAVSLDMWTDPLGYSMFFDDVQVLKVGDDQIAARPSAVQIQSITVANNTAMITWTSTSGRTYRMQYKDSLSLSNWTDVVPDIVATNSLATGTNALGALNQRFYRVALLP